MAGKERGAHTDGEPSDPHAERHASVEEALQALEWRVTAIERLLAAIPTRLTWLPRDLFFDVPGAGGGLRGAAENVPLKHCEWQTLYDGETPQRMKITGGNGGPGKVKIVVDGSPLDGLRTPNTTFVEGKKIRVHFEKDEPPPGGPEPFLDFTSITVERGVGPGPLAGTHMLTLRPCEWHTVSSLLAKACVRIVNNGLERRPIEIEVDGVRKDDLGHGAAAQYEGKTIRVHATGTELALVSIEPCR